MGVMGKAAAPQRAADSAALRRRRRVRLVSWCAVALFAAVLGWGGWQLWQLGSTLMTLRDVAGQAQAHVRAGEVAALSGDLKRIRELATRADAAASAPAVALAARLPWLGDDVTVTRELAGAAADLGAATTGLDPLVDRIAQGGTADLSLATEARAALVPVREAADAAAARLGRLDLGGLVLPIADDVTRLREGLAKVGPAVDTLSPYLDALTILTSSEGRHTWFVAMQNLGEARPSGGMIGSWLLLRADNGTLKVVRKGLNDELDTTHQLDYSASLPDGYRQVWGDSLDNWRSFTLSPHFPDNARLLALTWNVRGAQQVDGVLALGQGVVRLLAAATGPVEVDGRSIPASELADYLMVGVYRDYPDPKKKDAVVGDIIAQVLGKLTGGRFDFPALFAAALDGPGADYLQLWSSDKAIQKKVEAAGVSGAFPDEPGPVATVRLANAAANKMDSFVHLGAEYRLGACTVDDGGVATRGSTFTVTLRNAAPDGLPAYVTGKGDLLDGRKHPVGSTRDYVIVHTPVQATLTSATLDGEPALVQTAWVGNRQMLVIDVALEPGQTAKIELGWDEFPTDDEDRAFSLTPQIVLPPLANPAESRVVAGTPC